MRLAFRVVLVWISTCLAACNGLEQRSGIAPVLDPVAVQRASANSAIILQALAADAGLSASGSTDWYLVSEAGFNYVDDSCRAYFHELFFLNRGREQTKSGLAAAGQTTAAILGVTGAAAPTLAIVAQAFGMAINATDLVAGTFLYQLPPATTQGFVEKLQLAFRDAAAAQHASINSPTIAYHMIQRYLDLCLPPRIEAEITKQISSTTAIPVAQGPGSLFSIETASTPSAAALNSAQFFRTRIEAPVPTMADKPLPPRRKPDEALIIRDTTKTLFVREVQKALCELESGTVDSSTLDAVGDYLKASGGRVPKDLDPRSPSLRPRLQNVISDVRDCAAAGFANAYEVGRFGVPAETSTERVKRMQTTLATLLKSKGSSLAVDITGRFDSQTRAGIAEFRKLTGTAGNQIDFDFDFKFLQS